MKVKQEKEEERKKERRGSLHGYLITKGREYLKR